MLPMVSINTDGRKPIRIPVVTLLAWKGATHLETLGMTHSRGSVCQVVRKRLGLKLSMRKADVHEIVVNLCKQLEDQRDG